MITLMFLAIGALMAVSFAAGRYSALDKYQEAKQGCEVIARWDAKAAAWLRAQERFETTATRPLSAEKRLEAAHAALALVPAGVAGRFKRGARSGAADRDLTDGEIRARAEAAAPRHSVLHWPGTLSELLPAQVRHEVLVGGGVR